MTAPLNQKQYVQGDIVDVVIEVIDASKVKEMSLMIDGKLYQELPAKSQTIQFDTKGFRLGDVPIQLVYTTQQNTDHSDYREITIFSDRAPKDKKATVVNRFKHNPDSYTQGFEFYNCDLYEGTGQWGKSQLQQIALANNGQILRAYPIPSDQFGEGITILNDTIYQLTYRAGICYMYDMDFKNIGQFSYSEEGWGLCNDGKSLIMSDGSHQIEWRNPETFELEKTIEVYDNFQGILNVNELELYKGKLLANVYRENYLVEIDTATGKVLSKINCAELVAEKPVGSDVLNGIAYDPCEDRLFLTGKLWDTIYEVTID